MSKDIQPFSFADSGLPRQTVRELERLGETVRALCAGMRSQGSGVASPAPAFTTESDVERIVKTFIAPAVAGASTDPLLTGLGTGTGSVTSVALTAPSIFTVGGSPVTTAGTLALSLATQAANVVLAGPASGGAAVPAFRALAAADLAGLAGTYTPALANVANLDASTAYECQYLRVGNTVVVSGRVDVDPTAGAASTQLGISLPVASNLGAAEDCAGAAFASGVAGQGAAVVGDAANNRAQLQFVSGDTTNQAMYFTFCYQVI